MKLAQFIIDSGHTDRELGKLSNVSHTQVWRIRTLKDLEPKYSTIEKLLKAMNKKWGDLD